MLLFRYPSKNDAVNELDDRLRQLSLAFKSEVDVSLGMPILIDGATTVSGVKNIIDHLGQLAGELQSSRFCSC